jgi:hypothetical protein
MPGSEPIERVLAKDQPQYIPLPMVYLDTPSRPVISRWRLSEVERAAVAAGADVVLTQLIFDQLYHPVHLQVTMPDEMPVLLDE